VLLVARDHGLSVLLERAPDFAALGAADVHCRLDLARLVGRVAAVPVHRHHQQEDERGHAGHNVAAREALEPHALPSAGPTASNGRSSRSVRPSSSATSTMTPAAKTSTTVPRVPMFQRPPVTTSSTSSPTFGCAPAGGSIASLGTLRLALDLRRGFGLASASAPESPEGSTASFGTLRLALDLRGGFGFGSASASSAAGPGASATGSGAGGAGSGSGSGAGGSGSGGGAGSGGGGAGSGGG